MKIASRATPEGLSGHMWRGGHGLSTTDLQPYICGANKRTLKPIYM